MDKLKKLEGAKASAGSEKRASRSKSGGGTATSRRNGAAKAASDGSSSARTTLKGGKALPAGKKAGPLAAAGPRALFLIGASGSGKSTVGRLLAIRMGNHFVDLEQEISLRVGMAIPMIVNRFGEEAFRDLEAAVLEKLFESGEHDGLVIAAGEGVVDSARNVEFMRRRGLVCFLHASFEEVCRRLGSEVPPRPSWNDRNLLLKNYDGRSKLYSGAAHVTLPTDQRDPSQIVLELAQKLEEHQKGKTRTPRASRRVRPAT